MNRKLALALVIATAAAAAGNAFADDITVEAAPFQSKLTRAEVRAEYIASRDAVAAITGEDSGSAYIASQQGAQAPAARVATRTTQPQQ